MRGIAFVGGSAPSRQALREIAECADLLVAADSGLVLCEDAGLEPDWILGDMDSLDDPGRLEKYPADRVLRANADKDATDTELALAFLQEKRCNEVWLVGGGGGRLDHLFAIRAIFEREHPPHRWFPGSEDIRLLEAGRALTATLPPGSLVSLFPLGTGPWAAESAGLKWPLGGLGWERGSAWISNVANEGAFEIRAVRGRFMIIMPMLFGCGEKKK